MKNLNAACYSLFVGILVFAATAPLSGQTWQPTNGPLGGTARAVAIDSTGKIFVGTSEGVFLSTTGDSWQRTNGTLNASFATCMLVSPDSNHVFVGTTNVRLYKSTDSGDSWERQHKELPASNIQAISSVVAGKIFVGSDRDGVFRSSDGVSWTQFNNGLADLRVFATGQSGNGDLMQARYKPVYTDMALRIQPGNQYQLA